MKKIINELSFLDEKAYKTAFRLLLGLNEIVYLTNDDIYFYLNNSEFRMLLRHMDFNFIVYKILPRYQDWLLKNDY